MDRNRKERLLQTLIDYFEAGNRESDHVAKTIIEWDSEHLPDWREEIQRLRTAGEWTGLRAPEADIIAASLRSLQRDVK